MRFFAGYTVDPKKSHLATKLGGVVANIYIAKIFVEHIPLIFSPCELCIILLKPLCSNKNSKMKHMLLSTNGEQIWTINRFSLIFHEIASQYLFNLSSGS